MKSYIRFLLLPIADVRVVLPLTGFGRNLDTCELTVPLTCAGTSSQHTRLLPVPSHCNTGAKMTCELTVPLTCAGGSGHTMDMRWKPAVYLR